MATSYFNPINPRCPDWLVGLPEQAYESAKPIRVYGLLKVDESGNILERHKDMKDYSAKSGIRNKISHAIRTGAMYDGGFWRSAVPPEAIKRNVAEVDSTGQVVRQYDSMRHCLYCVRDLSSVPVDRLYDIIVSGREHMGRRFAFVDGVRTMGKRATRAKTVEQLNESGQVLASWPSLIIACSAIHSDSSTLSQACRSNKPYKGFYYRYKRQ